MNLNIIKTRLEVFNQKTPVGTAVRYFPIAGDKNFVETKTRSEAWALGHGQLVVKVEGVTGGVCVEHIQRMDQS